MPRKGDQIAGSDTQVAAFLFALARGATVEGAAAAAGLKASTLYYRRKRCAVFAQAWREALEAWDADAAAEGEEGRGTIVRWHAGRGPMRKRKRPVEFDRARKQAFLDRFAETCNLEASAAAAGISLGPVYRALQADAAFAAGFDDAMAIGYPALEAEAVRQELAAQQAYRIAPGAADEEAAAAQSFARTLALLREYKRGHGRIGRRPVEGRLTRWSFDEAMAALEKRLKIFGVRVREGEQAPDD